MKIITLLLVIFLAGCATAYSGIVPAGQGTFVVSKQQSNPFKGLGTLKTDLINDATAYCQTSGKTLKLIDTKESQPPYIIGNVPRVELTFSCEGGKRKGRNS